MTVGAAGRWDDLAQYAFRIHSQTGEEGILLRIFSLIGVTTKFAVEIGAGNGYTLSNTRLLRQLGWNGLMFDPRPDGGGVPGQAAPATAASDVAPVAVTPGNVNELLAAGPEADVLSIDIDGNDYWIWKAVASRPRVVVAEVNAGFPAAIAQTIQYDVNHRFDGTHYFGATPRAWWLLGREKGYRLIYLHGLLNAFFVREDLAADARSDAPQYQPYEAFKTDEGLRPWVTISEG